MLRYTYQKINRDPITAFLGSIGAAAGFGTAATATTAATTSAIVAGTVITAGTVAGTASIVSGAKKRAEAAEKSAKGQIARSRAETDKEIAALEKQQSLEASGKQEATVRKTAREKQRRKIASAEGRRSTILTSPLGVPGVGSTGGKKELTGT
ncbi:hypothetical protein KAR91_35305 [Candidatus Pacearchaeota archaeon]|nr:hypothetical protein [Candidatus Pacearchaeota archaeon]